MIPVMALVSMIAFSMILLLPGDPALAILGPEQARNTALYESLRRDLGLDQPVGLQYLSWAGKVVSGALGRSARSQQPVGWLMLQAIGPAAQLALSGMVLAFPTALAVGGS